MRKIQSIRFVGNLTGDMYAYWKMVSLWRLKLYPEHNQWMSFISYISYLSHNTSLFTILKVTWKWANATNICYAF